MIIARIFGCRSSAANMCSVRQSPMPSAPSSRARRAPSGVVGVRAHAQPAQLVGPAEHALEVLVDLRLDERHVVERHAAARAVDRDQVARLDDRAVDADRLAPRGRSRARSAPTTAGRPIPRATSAACDALPPSDVRIPRAAWKPATSSASVNGRTRITSRPSPAASTAAAGREDDRALRGARRGADALGEHLEVGARVERRVQQRVEPAGVDRGRSPARRSAAPRRPRRRRSAPPPARVASRCASGAGTAAPSSIVNSVSCMSP